MSQKNKNSPRSPLIIKPFLPAHGRTAFSCGVKRIDSYFRDGVHIQGANLARLYVGVERSNPNIVVGYYAIHNIHLDVGQIPVALVSEFRRDAVLGEVYVAMLAVDTRHQGKGFGRLLFANALKRSKSISHETGVWAVVLDAVDSEVEAFYRRFGFETLQTGTPRLFLPTDAIP
jgi:GNAT superfamily N-acetyltransferase